MTEKEILEIFQKTGAVLQGHFKLSSGLHSGQYLQCARVLQYPRYAENLCKALAEKFNPKPLPGWQAGKTQNPKPNVVIAPALGGILVSYEVARALGAKSLFTERTEGRMVLRRGFELNKKDKVLVVEDVVTTGISTKEVIEIAKSYGATLVGVGCLVDRSKDKIDFGAPFKSLIKIDIPTFEPEACPLCKDKIPLTKPGSRLGI